MERNFYKPASPGLVVPDENGVPIPAEGKWINKTTFISRLKKEGALIEGQIVNEIKPAPAKSAPAKKEADK